jgi:hypothetical protein
MAVITPKSRQIINNKLPNFDIGNYIKPIVGRVEGIILGENTPNADLYSKYGKQYGIGTIFYTLYSSDGSTNISTVTEGELLNGALVLPARPFFPNDKQFPLLGELVYLVTLPNAKSVTEIDKEFSYYLGPINIWNNSQSNPLFTDQQIFLGKSFSQRNDIPNINIFEGDRLIKARYNSAIRFSSSNRSNKNYWNISKKSNDQIIIISNGYNTNSDFHTEDINKDDSTIVLASSQVIPLNTTVTTSNPITKTIIPKEYSGDSQIILNSNRLVLNSKKDDILLYSHKNTEVYSKNNISLNSENILLNSNKIILGQNNTDSYPTQPAVLGNNLENILIDLIKTLSSVASALTSTVSTPAGTPLVSLNAAGGSLSTSLTKITNDLEKIKSTVVYINK